jgi:hypothetical protein
LSALIINGPTYNQRTDLVSLAGAHGPVDHLARGGAPREDADAARARVDARRRIQRRPDCFLMCVFISHTKWL